ncbi:conjugative transposon protein TraM [Mucilaginibacter sp. RS28]|uniref:Conjugative transposon protein TraM n=1 Tax=Mucilaginibacter straminoryzae TaxID=2932774 RepID=A0A9X1X004_9SPHI|nr:conjugative transposon protein TraM [Mucilaginibacter straminoryzae]MCJ8208116.1 conjugative transposon protein TraM [Mucilaginibacter straminoryzae]
MDNLKMQSLSQKQRRALLVLPVVMLPFLAFLFYALGGGKANANATPVKAGLNLQLPSANLKTDSSENKLSFYAQAAKDSARFREARKQDPYYQTQPSGDNQAGPTLQQLTAGMGSTSGSNVSTYQTGNSRLTNTEGQITRQLEELNRRINQPATRPVVGTGDTQQRSTAAPLPQQPAAENLGEDPQLKQLDGMLDKIMELQNPQLAAQKAKTASEKNRGQVYTVATGSDDSTGSLMGQNGIQRTAAVNGFYELSSSVNDAGQSSAAPAIVYQSQTLTSGTTVRLRLSQDVFINGTQVPQGTFVSGICNVNGDRLQIAIKTIRYHNTLLPVAMSVYDMDGIEGINVPGAITRDAAKQGADQAIQGLDFYNVDPSIGAQAASAGIQAAKGLFSKKVRLVKVTIRAGYPVLLMDQNQRNQ